MKKAVHITEKHPREAIAKTFEKIVINAGIGRKLREPHFEDKVLPEIRKELASITGQMPQVRALRKSVAGFKAREGEPVGLRVTLRGRKMVDFFERLVRIVIPRIRDFRGIELEHIDASGVLNMGVREQFVFSEINPEDSRVVFSLGINIVPRGRNKEDAILRYRALGVPLAHEARKKEKARN